MADVLKILVASDIHLGYGEKDPIRGADSFDTFAEVFQIALREEADMVLLAGDLFHDNKPSRKALHKCMEILRDYCLGDKPVRMQVVSDQQANFHGKCVRRVRALKFHTAEIAHDPTAFVSLEAAGCASSSPLRGATSTKHRYRSVNFEDPHYNVQLPVFSIHGNHDDPAGDGGLAALDLLSTANLINYFGRAGNFEKISLSPILIQKGRTKVALYGLGHVRDERLGRHLDRKEVKVARPVEDRDDWFSILALHQNRLPRGAGIHAKGYIQEKQLPSCVDVVIWGHEHECLIGGGMGALADSVENDFVVLQPGSTTATALVEGEARPKHVALLSIKGDAWQMRPIPLTTVRPFAIREVALRDFEDDYDLHHEQGLMDFLAEKVEAMLEELRAANPEPSPPAEPSPPPTAGVAAPRAAPSRPGAPSSSSHRAPLLTKEESRRRFPLVRLKVDYGGFSTCNPQRFGQRFVDRVANPGEVLLFQKTKVKRREEKEAAGRAKRAGTAADIADMLPDPSEDPASQIQKLVADFLVGGKNSLRLLPQSELNTAVFVDFVGKDNKNAIRNQVEASLKWTQQYLATAARDALDAPTSRKDKQEAIEQQLELHLARDGKSTSGEPPGRGGGAPSAMADGDSASVTLGGAVRRHETQRGGDFSAEIGVGAACGSRSGLNHDVEHWLRTDDGRDRNEYQRGAPLATESTGGANGHPRRPLVGAADDDEIRFGWPEGADALHTHPRGTGAHKSGGDRVGLPNEVSTAALTRPPPQKSTRGWQPWADGAPANDLGTPGARSPVAPHGATPAPWSSSSTAADAHSDGPQAGAAPGHSPLSSPARGLRPLNVSGGAINRLAFDAPPPAKRAKPSAAANATPGPSSASLTSQPRAATQARPGGLIFHDDDDDAVSDDDASQQLGAPIWHTRVSTVPLEGQHVQPEAVPSVSDSRASSFASRRRAR